MLRKKIYQQSTFGWTQRACVIVCNNQVIPRERFFTVSLIPSLYLLAPACDLTACLLEERLIITSAVGRASYLDNKHILCQDRNLNTWIGFTKYTESVGRQHVKDDIKTRQRRKIMKRLCTTDVVSSITNSLRDRNLKISTYNDRHSLMLIIFSTLTTRIHTIKCVTKTLQKTKNPLSFKVV